MYINVASEKTEHIHPNQVDTQWVAKKFQLTIKFILLQMYVFDLILNGEKTVNIIVK